MEISENTGNWLKILIEKLNMPSTAEFCRKADLNRGLVDKLSKDMHSPRLDTLQKIKNAFPETNMNWLISGKGNVLEEVQDDDEVKLLELFRTKVKSEGNPITIQKDRKASTYNIHSLSLKSSIKVLILRSIILRLSVHARVSNLGTAKAMSKCVSSERQFLR